jgi:hypothetical protein
LRPVAIASRISSADLCEIGALMGKPPRRVEMQGTQVVLHKGKQIVFVDFKDCNEKQSLQVIAEGVKLIRVLPPKSALVLSDFTNAIPAPQLIQALREFVSGNTPYVKASAAIGLNGISKVLFDATMRFTGRNIPVFDDVQKAQDWLASQ